MKNYNITKLLFAFSLLLTFVSCSTNDNIEEISKTLVRDFTAADLNKLHGGSEKKWKLVEVIIPDSQRDYPSVINNACVEDDVYTFKASATNKSLENVTVDLGDSRCFETISDAESFNAQLLYVPYKLDNEDVVETTLILKYSSIKNIANNGTYTSSNTDAYRLVELTEDRMIFSNATYVGEYTYGYVFERIVE